MNLCEHNTEMLDDHEKRIQTLEKSDSVIGTKLDIQTKILASIAGMMGAAIIGVFIGLLTHTIKIGG